MRRSIAGSRSNSAKSMGSIHRSLRQRPSESNSSKPDATLAPSACGRGPLHDRRAPGHAAAKRGEHERVALPHPTLGYGVAQRDRYRGGRGITEAIDVNEDLRTIEPEALGDGFDDAGVRLVRNEEVDVLEPQPRRCERLLRSVGPRRNGELEHRG